MDDVFLLDPDLLPSEKRVRSEESVPTSVSSPETKISPPARSLQEEDLRREHSAPQMIVLIIFVVLMLILLGVIFYWYQYAPWEEPVCTPEEQARALRFRSAVSGVVMPYKQSQTCWYAVHEASRQPLTVSHMHAVTGFLRRGNAADPAKPEENSDEEKKEVPDVKDDQHKTTTTEEGKKSETPMYALQLLGCNRLMGLHSGKLSHKILSAPQTQNNWGKLGFWPKAPVSVRSADQGTLQAQVPVNNPAVLAFLTMVCSEPGRPGTTRLSSRIWIHHLEADNQTNTVALVFTLCPEQDENDLNSNAWARLRCDYQDFDPTTVAHSSLLNAHSIDCYVYEQDFAASLPLFSSRPHFASTATA